MPLSIGIVGLPNVGKSTLFKAVTNKQVDIQNYPFTTIEPNVGVVAVPDERVDALALFSDSAKKVYTTIEFIDIAGLVKGAAQGEGLGNKFLANIREVDAIAQVVRAFSDDNITHVHNRIDPADDIAIINTELVVADLDTATKRLDTTKRKIANDKVAREQVPMLERLIAHLQGGSLVSQLELSEPEELLGRELNLLTAKQFIYVINVSEAQLTGGWQPDAALAAAMAGAPWVAMCNKLELELSDVTAAEKQELLAEFNLPESGLDRLITESYRALGLLTFLTTGPDESRAWTAQIGDPIPRAVRAIHTDFEKLFIRADVINWKTLLEAGSYANARAKGLVKTVGKDYIIQDGDVVEVRI